FLSGGGELSLSGSAEIQFLLNILFVQIKP
ncbi:unnamed protein product, partial [marine sediment metagenome]